MTKEEFVQSEYDAHLFSWSNIGLGLGGLVVLALAPLDYFVDPEHFQSFLSYRIVTALSLLGLFGLNRLKALKGFQSLLGVVGGAIVGTMLALMIARVDGHRSVYFAGFILVLLFVCNFLPLRAGYGVAAAVVVCGLYSVPILLYDTIVDRTFFVAANVLIYICAATMLLFQNLNYRRLIEQFGLQYELELQRRNLEGQVLERTAEIFRSVRELHATNASLQALITASPLGIFSLDSSGRVTLWNPAAERTLGWSAAEVLGGAYPLMPAGEAPDRRADLGRVLSGETIPGQEIEYRTRKGTPITVQLSAAPLYGPEGEVSGVIALLDDVTEQKKMERAILEAKKDWEEGFNTINDAITIHDLNFTIVRANRAAEELLGVPLSFLGQRKCYELYHGTPCPPDGCPSCVVLKTGEPTLTEVFEPHLKKQIEIKALPRLDREGRVTGLVHVVRDQTEASKIKAQLFQSQKMEAVGQLAGGIAHDFNNILSAITCFADLVRVRLDEGDPTRVYVDQIIASAERAAGLTQSLLAFSRKQVISLKPVELNGIVRNQQALLARLLGEQVELRAELAGCDLIVVADAGLIEQVLMNLATNARDAIARTGLITIATAAFEMDDAFVRARGFGKPGAYALLTVSDTGRGMDAATREKIFEPFFTTKEPGKGTGLGSRWSTGPSSSTTATSRSRAQPGREHDSGSGSRAASPRRLRPTGVWRICRPPAVKRRSWSPKTRRSSGNWLGRFSNQAATACSRPETARKRYACSGSALTRSNCCSWI